MKKAIKLLLSILPISSISVLGVVSCSTTNSSEKQPEKPNESTPKTPPKPDESKQPDNNNTNPGDSNNGSNKPETKPDPSEKPQNDKPSDYPEIHKVDFSDVDRLSKDISFDNFVFYKQKDLITAWNELITNQEKSFKEVIFSKNVDILNKYKISFESNFSDVKFDQEKGVIENVKIKFTKDKESKILMFNFTGFKKVASESIDKINNKENYIKAKTTIDRRISGLFPSLLAYMLLFAEDSKKYEDLQSNNNAINFDDLKNKNPDLFDNNFVGFSAGTKELLFDYNDKDKTKYKDKIIAARYDDITGELGVEVEITNREESTLTEPRITKKFNFKGFRSVDFKDQNNNVLSLTLLPKDLKEIANTKSLKSFIDTFLKAKHFNKSLKILEDESIKNFLFKKLIVNIEDNKNHIYKGTQTFKLDNNDKKNFNKSIVGLKDGTTLYPFHTRITKDSINDGSVTLLNNDNQNQVKVEFTVDIPIYASTLSDLTSHTTSQDKVLKYKVTTTTKIN
ncbi:mycoides cluster lipoprotein, LppA/P72 family [synthetic Mycoplasma mycoides JCVI-syn1.0]|uniref:LppA family lipoprotein n=1 Tax=Mycoplasma mycoides subsp. capri TaxID=40477 RepID=A0AB38GD40_MYCMC|nr:LppA family lipoprotein [Mycoplasma mycoides]ADH21762.1 mycoides cluster lipoprotein, LppA/P72 family [synthetic Mycoplasma mycoides JCVI-syn1.0]ACU78867.1 mycoides cluster lipoprotein, LppA/P72 family [Mycoplasma mycoides subsp. capri str. GM12]ACU79699.1 mycoides cluster lipoprotein, LppA/P72 family [Mycoplasma mycoides subsp. capri str. GM12]SRX60953.1 LppA family lipoprotein [Mycoplasma mycoides subsp. capri]SRX62499.1 LppA family lipoprotein [Mycoplasma mycoides subsp. capri]